MFALYVQHTRFGLNEVITRMCLRTWTVNGGRDGGGGDVVVVVVVVAVVVVAVYSVMVPGVGLPGASHYKIGCAGEMFATEARAHTHAHVPTIKSIIGAYTHG